MTAGWVTYEGVLQNMLAKLLGAGGVSSRGAGGKSDLKSGLRAPPPEVDCSCLGLGAGSCERENRSEVARGMK